MQLPKFIRRLLLVVLVLIFSVTFLQNNYGQFPATGFQRDTVKSATNCEESLRVLDSAIAETKRFPDSSLIVILRRGAGESDARLSKRRFRLIERYMTEARRTAHVIAEGSPTNGLGVIDLYVRGKLEGTIYLKRNSRSVCPVPIG